MERISLLSSLATLATVILIGFQISQQKEQFDIAQRAQFLIVLRDPCQVLPLKLAALDALIQIDHDYHRSPDLRWAQLRRADLAGMDLSRANLQNADLREAKFDKARLVQADLTGADLSGADLSGAQMDNAILMRIKRSDSTAFPPGFKILDGIERQESIEESKDCPGDSKKAAP